MIAAGEVVLQDAWRTFDLGVDRRRTLKELVTLRRRRDAEQVEALAGVDLQVGPGETVGIVGRNGAGKTSTLKVLAGIIPLHRGRAECGGRVATLIELGAGFGRDFTGRENILLSGALHGLGREEMESRMEDIVEFSELGRFVDVPVRTYSSGMLVRLGFSIAAHLDADVLLIDEVLAVGDVAFQRKCLRRISERIAAGTTLVLVSHAPAAIERTCARVVVLDQGSVVFDGPTAEGLLHYHQRIGAVAVAVPEHRTVFVADVDLHDGAGHARTTFRAGDELRIVITLGVRGETPPCRVAFELRRATGEPVFGAEEDVDLRGRPAQLTFTVPALHLLGGDYDLVLGVHEPGDQEPGIDRMLTLSVDETPGATGVADLRGTWSLDTAVAS